MKFEQYFIRGKDQDSNCIIRTFCKLFNQKYDEVNTEINKIAHELGFDHFTEIEVFEKYLNNKGFYSSNSDYKDNKIKDLNLKEGKYAVFCWDKKIIIICCQLLME